MSDEKNNQTTKGTVVCFHQRACPYFKPENRPPVRPIKTFVDLAASLKEPTVEPQEIPEKKLTSKQFKKIIADYLEYSTKVLDEPIPGKKPVVRISMYDRLNALIRIPEVKDEIANTQRETCSHKKIISERNFEEKYNIHFRLLSWLLTQPERIKEVLKQFEKSECYDTGTLHVFNRLEKDSPGCLQPYRDGRHIILAIDLSKKKRDIEQEIESVINLSSKNVSRCKTRSRAKTLDGWEMYDLYHNDRLSFVEIARRKWPERAKKRGSDSYSLKNEYMQVKRAHDGAKNIIHQVREEIGMNTKNHN